MYIAHFNNSFNHRRYHGFSFSFTFSIDHEVNAAFEPWFPSKGTEEKQRQTRWYLWHRCEIQRDIALPLNKATGATDVCIYERERERENQSQCSNLTVTFFSISNVLRDMLPFVEHDCAM